MKLLGKDDDEEKKVLFSVQKFLNKPGFHSTASIVITATVENYNPVETELHINDCSRTIYLSLGVDEQEYENTLHKIGVLAEAFSSFQKALPQLREEYIRIKEERKKKDEEESKE